MTSNIIVLNQASLSISCVTFNVDKELFLATIDSLVRSCDYAKKGGSLSNTCLYLIDNGPTAENFQYLKHIEKECSSKFDAITVLSGHGNVGYGRGNNLAILQSQAVYHLVLNPDVLLDEENIKVAIDYMEANKDIGLLAPDAKDENGQRQYLAKREPSFLVLFSRALNFSFLKEKITRQLNEYECRDIIPSKEPVDIEIASGCYMFLRGECIKKVHGFDVAFFMYFEDFDLSRRLRKITRIVHHPNVRIIHYGGGAFGKGIKHIYYFVTSFIKYLIHYES